MYDNDIKKIFGEIPSLREKTIFITEKKPSPQMQFNLSKYGEVQTIELPGFIGKVNEIKSTWIKPKLELIYKTLQVFSHDKTIRTTSGKDLLNLHLYGEINLSLLDENNKNKYHIERPTISNIKESIIKGALNIIHGSLGNGKTMIAQIIAKDFHENGYRVFQIKTLEQGWEKELENILKENTPLLILVENYHRYMEFIKHYNIYKKDKHRILLTERSDTNDIKIDGLNFFDCEIEEFDINKIERSSISKIIESFDQNGLWGKSAALKTYEKERKITTDYKSEFSNLLLDIFESPFIKEKISAIFNQIKSSNSHKKVVIFSAITSFLGYEIDQYDANDYIDINIGGQFRSTPELKQLVGFENSMLSIRSSIFAQHLLETIATPEEITIMLADMLHKSHKVPHHDRLASQIRKDLVRFGNIQAIVPSVSSRKAAITNYYERIKNIGNNSTNPHFWLQYAICQLTFGELDGAEIFFDTAYSYAKKSHWYETEPLDNHYARFLLEKATNSDNLAEAFPIFEKAHYSIRKQNRRHYPYKVASGYADFFNKHKNSFSEDNRNKFKTYLNDVLKNIDKLDDRTKAHRNVTECQKILSSIVSKM